MSASPRLPDFVIIGAAKAATTWIQMRLQENPSIFMPDPEPHFFSREYDKGEDYYRSWFEDAPGWAALVGEKSADYLSDPATPARLAAMMPQAKLVAQLRNPVDRAYSDYKMLYRRGLVSDRPEDYLSSPDNPEPRFLLDGLYGRHLSTWLRHFDREQLLVFPFEDVKADPAGVIERVSAHIDAPIAPDTDRKTVSRRENNSREKLLPLPLRQMLAPFKETVRPLRGKPWFEGARALLAREVKYPALDPALRRRMEEFYRDDIALTEEITGLDLAHWKVPAASVAA
ncbi:sulfotransferase domain-containing protein [Qipengyuania aquimaris]|uniref:sulfotransferase domain-containing protein n=1 Tax=Qipengyuania aquimaris TaxID=255984 RepID=UPI001C9824E6|nr:sulfotransferase domain-containing protein [Qipengyuania aquimaris]MBY6128404.1 sulfotransferase domain-containing protein [Qipengyuania aquimaris]